MASIPNLNTLRTSRRGPRRRGGSQAHGDVGNEPSPETILDTVVQQTDHDASSSRMSAVRLGYLDDAFAQSFCSAKEQPPKRYPIMNRGTYVRTRAIDHLVLKFLRSNASQKKQIVSLGAGSDTRFFRLCSPDDREIPPVEYHELDFETNVHQKRRTIASSPQLNTLISHAAKLGRNYHLHAIDLRTLIAKSPPLIPHLDPDLPTLLLSECCLCYLPPETAESVVQYFTLHISTADLALVLYEPIRPFDAFGRTMVSNLASRGIHLQTLQRYATLEAQRTRLRVAGFSGGQAARDVRDLWESEEVVGKRERERVERLEWLDEIEEWDLLASHYVVAWGWRGADIKDAWGGLEGGRTEREARQDEMG